MMILAEDDDPGTTACSCWNSTILLGKKEPPIRDHLATPIALYPSQQGSEVRQQSTVGSPRRPPHTNTHGDVGELPPSGGSCQSQRLDLATFHHSPPLAALRAPDLARAPPKRGDHVGRAAGGESGR